MIKLRHRQYTLVDDGQTFLPIYRKRKPVGRVAFSGGWWFATIANATIRRSAVREVFAQVVELDIYERKQSRKKTRKKKTRVNRAKRRQEEQQDRLPLGTMLHAEFAPLPLETRVTRGEEG